MARPYVRRRVLWVHARPAFPSRGGGELRLSGLVEGAIAAGHEVLLVLPAPNDRPGTGGLRCVELTLRRGVGRWLTKVVSRHPLRSPRATTGSMRAARRAIASFSPDVAVVSEVMAWSLAAPLLPAGIPVVYDAHNVESAMFAAFAREEQHRIARRTFAIDARRVARDERELLRRADATSSVSESDLQALERLGGRRVRLVPSSVPTPQVTAEPGTSGAVGIFVGTLSFPPNARAVRDLVEQIWPAVLEVRPEARLLVAGRRPSPETRRLLSAPFVDFHEDASDLAPLYGRARCAVLPIRGGSGTRLKVYEAMSFGVPVVGSPLVFAGLDVRLGDEGVVAVTTADFAESVLDLFADPTRAAVVGAAARRAFVERLAWSSSGRPAFVALLEELCAGSVQAE